MDSKTAQALLDDAEKQMGSSLFGILTAKMRKRRIPKDRKVRKFMQFNELWRIAKKQQLICGICKDPEKPLAKDRRFTVLDHIDPQRIDFDSPDNHQAAHASCNRAKSSKNQTETSKMLQLNPTLGDEDEI